MWSPADIAKICDGVSVDTVVWEKLADLPLNILETEYCCLRFDDFRLNDISDCGRYWVSELYLANTIFLDIFSTIGVSFLFSICFYNFCFKSNCQFLDLPQSTFVFKDV